MPPSLVPAGLRDRLAELFPGSQVLSATALAPDRSTADNLKAEGYGAPLRIGLRDPEGNERTVVFHTAVAGPFGHDRRSDRAAEMLLAWDTFGSIPGHVRALDTGAVQPDGRLVPLAGAGEFYLVTEWAPGTPYAEDLRRVVSSGCCQPLDLERARALARRAAAIHAVKPAGAGVYVRAVRDLVGHGEGILGMVDGYPPDTPAAPPGRLRAIEHSCIDWRWRLRGREGRLSRTHGDYHPFNVVFEEGLTLHLLDAARGCAGDPADDVTAMAVNYVFFAAAQPGAWKEGTGPLWRAFWAAYGEATGDAAIGEVLAPWLAWRCLVVSNPRFYPHLPVEARDRMLRLAERALGAPVFEPEMAEELFP